MNVLQLETRPLLEIRLGEDRTYMVEYPVTAVVAAEKASGKTLKSVAEWFDLDLLDVAPVLHAGLAKHHPDVSLDEIKALCENLGAEGVLEIRHALIQLNFPLTMGKIEKARRSKSPNVTSGAVS
jgi:hypothetical protein